MWEFFGNGVGAKNRHYITREILLLIQQDKKEEAEEYFLDNTIFNPKNRK